MFRNECTKILLYLKPEFLKKTSSQSVANIKYLIKVKLDINK